MKAGISQRALGDAPYCGDLCASWTSGSKTILCIVDGLGHGRAAAAAAEAAISYVDSHLEGPLPEIFEGCDRAISATRGVAMAIVEADIGACRLSYACIGNTRGQLYGKRTIRLQSQYGIVGGGFRTLTAASIAYDPEDILVLWTDGVSDDVDISRYGPKDLAEPQRLAERVIEDHALGTDDAAVLVFLDPNLR
ncbi:MAG: SpoIIE family protein phosphatase [Kiloniellales bacterium]|nr:SpoIIE family protein phosphatase [Kiloniellales bacterium]